MGEMTSFHLSPPAPLTSEHVLSAFECGEPSLDDWLRRRAQKTRHPTLRAASSLARMCRYRLLLPFGGRHRFRGAVPEGATVQYA